MNDALIASTARSPIGRAAKGSMSSIRPDDLAAKLVSAALDALPGLDPGEVEDLYLGCGEPYDEQGANMARRVAVQLGLEGLPGGYADPAAGGGVPKRFLDPVFADAIARTAERAQANTPAWSSRGPASSKVDYSS
jgi:hypothetical protein